MRTARSRRRLNALRVGFVCAIGSAPLLLASSAPAAQGLGGWNVNADANVVDILIDNTTGLAGIHPFTEADFPEAQSTFQTGPFGSGLATVLWPGAAGANFGSLSAELPFPPQLQPLLSKLNDPMRADAQYPSGPAKATYPSSGSNGVAEMASTAGTTGTTATAALSDLSANSFISFSSAKGTSASSATSTAQAASSSDLGGISLLGLIDIGSVTSTATATSDGHNSSGSSATHVSGVTVLGQTASIGSDGLVLPKIQLPGLLSSILDPIVQGALDQVVSGLGLKLTTFPAVESHNGASESVTSGGLQFQITPPSSIAPTLETAFQTIFKYLPLPSQAAIIPTLPGLLQGATLTITIGRSTAAASAAPPFSTPFTPPPVTTPPAYPPSTGSGSGTPYVPGSSIPATPGRFVPGTPGSSSPVVSTPALSSLPESSSAASQLPSSASPSGGATKLIDLSSPLGAGAVVLGLLVAAGFGFGLFRLARMLLPEDAAPICPLGQDNP